MKIVIYSPFFFSSAMLFWSPSTEVNVCAKQMKLCHTALEEHNKFFNLG